MYGDASEITTRIRNAVLTALGLVMMLSLPGIWVAWTPNMLLGILGTSIASGVFYILLYREEPLEKIADRADRSAITHLTDEAMDDLSGLGPLVFHHRQAGDPEFQRKIDDLKARHFPDERKS